MSQRFKFALLNEIARGTRQYEIAKAAGLHPTVLSAIKNDIRPVRPGDQRVLRVGQVLGLSPDECFEHPAGTPDPWGR